MRQRSFWALTAVGWLPLPQLTSAWWTLLAVWVDYSDEWQLSSFIVSYQTAKFVSMGVWGLVRGALLMALCIHAPQTFPCATYAPQLTLWDAVFAAWQVAVVWHAHNALLGTRPAGRPASSQRVDSGNRRLSPGEHVDDSTGTVTRGLKALLAGADEYRHHGGVLQMLMWWQAGVIVTCLVAVAFAAVAEIWRGEVASPPLSLAIAYWARTAYALACLPYLALKLPLAMQLYVCGTPTGYDRDGRTVPLARRA